MAAPSTAKMLSGRVALVTGATRGIGRGIALQVGQAGATVYVTGRTKDLIDKTCDEIRERGGEAVGVVVDHSNDAEVEALFKRIEREQDGKLDLCVNNAYAGVKTIMDNLGTPFWETDPIKMWDDINAVGLRNHYLCSAYAAK